MVKKTESKKTKSDKQSPEGKARSTPTHRSCGALESYFNLVDRFPEFRFNQASIEGFTKTFMESGRAIARTGIVTIPTVVHVVFRTEDENISDSQIASQITVLNKDFTATNLDVGNVPVPFNSLVGNPQIKFELVSRDPAGNAVNGITRTQTDKASFGINNGVKSSATGGIEPWDTKKYLNIWVCTLRDNLLGYAQFPGGPRETDGVVILNTAFGTNGTASDPFHKGRTTTHEVGHYLNLSHIWGESRIPNCEDSDFVNDTPNQFGPNTGKPVFPRLSCNNAPNGDMFMNYMDYVDDEAMFMFTGEQVSRMQATLAGPRSTLVSG
jgi:hypothetical protein